MACSEMANIKKKKKILLNYSIFELLLRFKVFRDYCLYKQCMLTVKMRIKFIIITTICHQTPHQREADPAIALKMWVWYVFNNLVWPTKDIIKIEMALDGKKGSLHQCKQSRPLFPQSLCIWKTHKPLKTNCLAVVWGSLLDQIRAITWLSFMKQQSP